jgi:putative glycosyltransferase (TIGR04372 family)
VRDDGFYNDQSQSHRNASLDTYREVIKIVRERGGSVIRMGAPTAPNAPKVPGLIDYAHSRWKSEEMDLYLMRTARCFVGAVSGLSNLAVSLDLPSAFVNSISYDAQMWHPKARFIPKTVYTREGRALSQHELSSDQWRWHLFGADTMKNAGLRSEDNTSDEIREIVLEVLQDCTTVESQPRHDLVGLWEQSLAIPHYYGAALPSGCYLEKHRRTFLRDVEGVDLSMESSDSPLIVPGSRAAGM